MEAECNYWSRARLQRRRFLEGSAIGSGALALVVACGSSSNNNAGSKATNTTTAPTAAGTKPAASAATPAAAATSAVSITPTGSLTAAFSDGSALRLWNPLMWVSGNQTMYREGSATR